jgi:hypothetical protein
MESLKYSLDDMKKEIVKISDNIDEIHSIKCISIQGYLNSINIYFKCYNHSSEQKEKKRLLEAIKDGFNIIIHISSELKDKTDNNLLDSFIVHLCLNKMKITNLL